MKKRMTVMGPIMANIFHTVLWNKMAWTVLKQNKVVLHRRYVDDVLFESIDISKFGAYLDTCHPEISFSFEQEKDGKLPFIDVEAFLQQGKFVGLVVKVLDSQSRCPVFKTTGWLQGQLSLSSFRGW